MAELCYRMSMFTPDDHLIWFECQCRDQANPDHEAHTRQQAAVRIHRRVAKPTLTTAFERAAHGVPDTYEILFADGTLLDVWEGEVFDSPEQFTIWAHLPLAA